MELRGTNALLTGAAGGLGGYIARALAAEGVNLVLSDLSDADLEPLTEELRARGARVELVAADLSDRDRSRIVERLAPPPSMSMRWCAGRGLRAARCRSR